MRIYYLKGCSLGTDFRPHKTRMETAVEEWFSLLILLVVVLCNHFHCFPICGKIWTVGALNARFVPIISIPVSYQLTGTPGRMWPC